MQIDEIIFEVMAPLRFVGLVNGMRPTPLPTNYHWMMMMIPFSLAFATVASVGLFCATHIYPMQNRMWHFLEAMCEPQSTVPYVIGTNALGWVTYFNGSSTLSDPNRMDRRHQITSKLISDDASMNAYAFEMESLLHIARGEALSVAQFVDQYQCRDNIRVLSTSATIGTFMWALGGNDSLRRSPLTCEDVYDHCRDLSTVGINIRFMCAQTCGCDRWESGLWDVATSEYGCPQTDCKKQLAHRLKSGNIKCMDKSLANLTGSAGWNFMLSRMRITGQINTSIHQKLTLLGCRAFSFLPYLEKQYLCAENNLYTKFGAAPFCPISCGCREMSCSGMCPISCCLR